MARNETPAECLNTRWTVTTPEDRPVYIIGSTPELGEWNINRALPLHVQHVGGHVHDWNIDLTLPLGQKVEFKFVRKTDRGDILWEEGDNRVFVPSAPHCTIHWGRFRTRANARAA